MSWDPRKYGTFDDPIRQSDLNELASAYSCPKRFAYRKEEQFGGANAIDRAFGGACLGNAIHETLALYLDPSRPSCARVLSGEAPSDDALRTVIEAELDKAANGLPIEWGKKSRDAEVENAIAMTAGVLRTIPRYVAEVLIVEGTFRSKIETNEREYWLTGTVDLVYRPRSNPSAIAIADWKSGIQRQSEIVLDHGYQLGIYSQAAKDGEFFPGALDEGEPIRLGEYPEELCIVHLRDFVPYARKGTKTPTHRDEIAFYGTSEKVSFEKGDLRGPGWMRARRTESDVARLKVSIRHIVNTVRLRQFVEHLGDDCARCAFRHICLNEGYAPEGEAKRQLDSNLRDVDFDGFGDEFAGL